MTRSASRGNAASATPSSTRTCSRYDSLTLPSTRPPLPLPLLLLLLPLLPPLLLLEDGALGRRSVAAATNFLKRTVLMTVGTRRKSSIICQKCSSLPARAIRGQRARPWTEVSWSVKRGRANGEVTGTAGAPEEAFVVAARGAEDRRPPREGRRRRRRRRGRRQRAGGAGSRHRADRRPLLPVGPWQRRRVERVKEVHPPQQRLVLADHVVRAVHVKVQQSVHVHPRKHL